MNVAAVTTAVNATIIAVMNEQRRKVLAYFNAHKALSPERAIARDALEPALHATLEQLRAQGIIKDSGNRLSYLDADALLAYEKKMAKSGRIAVMAMVPVLVAVVVAIVVAITLSR
ncbi:MAG: hypothetical protein ACK4FW_09275 [Stenotrophomonas sp.]